MWKYRCKMQLIALGIGFLAGVVLMVCALFTNTGSVLVSQMPAEVAAFVAGNKILMCMAGGVVIAGIVNVILVAQLLMVQFNISPMLLYLIMFIAPTYLILIGTALVIPMVVLSIYGMWSLRSGRDKAFARARISGDAEILRIYELHHKLDPQYRQMAESCRKNADKARWVMYLGVLAVMCVIFFVPSMWIVMLIIIVYMFIFSYLARFQSSAFIPITRLLYEKCDPEACISAIVYYSTRRGKLKLTNQALMAQCLIYLDDPDLAQDVLITYPRKDSASVLTYWSLMSYIYYLQKDDQGLQRCYEEAQKVRLSFGQTGVMIRSEELSSIKNKIDLINGDFSTCKQYFLRALKNSPFPFQKADASYYIGLISFVEQDYPIAEMYFRQTIQIGNKLYFTRNAANYLAKIEAMNEAQEEEIRQLP